MASVLNENHLVTLPAAVTRLGVSRRTVQRLVEQGELPRVKVLGSTRFRASDLERIIREDTAPGPPTAPVKPLSERDTEVAEHLALWLADAFCTAIPALFAESPETVVGLTLPIACSLVRAEAKARRNRKHARKYRALQAEVREMLRTQPDRAAGPAVVAGTVPFDPGGWHTQLARGPGLESLRAP